METGLTQQLLELRRRSGKVQSMCRAFCRSPTNEFVVPACSNGAPRAPENLCIARETRRTELRQLHPEWRRQAPSDPQKGLQTGRMPLKR